MVKLKQIGIGFIILSLLSVCVWAAVTGSHDPWDGTLWDVTAPTEDIAYGYADKELRDLRKAVALRMNKEHETLATSSAGGVHKQGSARAFFQDAAPTTQVDTSAFDSGDLGSLWFDSNAAIDNQFNVLTATTPTWTPVSTEIIAVLLASNRQFAGTLTVDGATTLSGAVGSAATITLGAGADLIGSATSDITINSTAFTVAGATGNTSVGGTFESVGIATLADASVTKTTGAPAADAQIANKKYVDDQIAAYIASEVTLSAYTNEDSETNAMLKTQAYLAATDGYVSAVVTGLVGSEYIKVYVDTDNNPASGGYLVGVEEAGTTNPATDHHVSALVAEGEYFEVLCSGTPTILWKSFGTLSKPVDQD